MTMKILYLLIIVPLILFSFFLSKTLKSGRDYLVPSKGLPFVAVAFSIAACQFGSGMLIGGTQLAQQQPVGQGFWPAIYTLIAAGLSCFINIFVSPKYKEFGDSVTPPDFISVRYGENMAMRGYHAAIYSLSTIAVLVSQVVGFAGTATSAGFSYNTAIFICAVVVVLIAIGGGMTGVAWTNLVQYAAIMILLMISMLFTLGKLNENGISFVQAASEPFIPSKAMAAKLSYTACPMLISNLISYDYFMRFMSCRNIREAKKASALAGIILLATAIPIALIGAVANRFYRDVDSTAVFGIITQDMPNWMGGLMIITVLFAVLTSASALLTSAAGMLSRDLYAGIIMRNKPERAAQNLQVVIRVSMIVVAIIVSFFAIFYRQILDIIFVFSPFTAGTMFAPMVVGLFWKGANKKGAIAAMLCSITAALLHVTGVITLFDRVAGPALIGTIAIVLFSLIFDLKGKHHKDNCL